ncbi:MAG: DegT/DnrJ/EryC1/StrS family aminotransferase [Cyclobacteriaceae bacterium]
MTNRSDIFRHARSVRNQGRDDDNLQWLTHDKLGYNYRMSELNAALGVAQMRKIEWIVTKRAELAQLYLNKLKEVPDVICPTVLHQPSWFAFVVRVPEKVMDKLITQMHE